MNVINHIKNFFKFIEVFNVGTKKNYFTLVFGGLIAVVIELLGVSGLFPLIYVVMQPDAVKKNTITMKVYEFFGFSSTKELVFFLGVILAVIFILKSIYSVFYTRKQLQILSSWRSNLSEFFYKKFLSCNPEYYLSIVPERVVNLLHAVIPQVIENFANQMIIIFNLIFISIVLVLYTIYLNWVITFTCMTLITALILFNHLVLTKKANKTGLETVKSSEKLHKVITQSINGYKETKMHLKEAYFMNVFSNNVRRFATANYKFQLLNLLPGIFVELAILLVIIFSFLLLIYLNDDMARVSAELGVFVVIAFRFMPIINRLLVSIGLIKNSSYYLEQIYAENKQLDEVLNCDQSVPQQSNINLKKKISLENVSYTYPKKLHPSVKNINFDISPGEFIGITGPSGGGKSTIIKILLGFLTNFSGNFLCNNERVENNEYPFLRKLTGYVDQNTFLLNASIAENVAFGIEKDEIDVIRVRDALRKSQILEFVDSLSKSIDTNVGENGHSLSGGQRQRIAIARALYKNAKLLILDEASSALDVKTEYDLLNYIKSLRGEITLVVISHRISTLKECDKIYFIENGSIIESGTYSQLKDQKGQFNSFVEIS